MAEVKLVLKDGTEYIDGECGYADRRLWCWLKNTTFAKAFADFSNPEKTKEIIVIRPYKTITYYGFEELDIIRRTEFEPGKYTIDVRLTGENIYSEVRTPDEMEQGVTEYASI